jgi:transcriptional regulator with XRE-family HTH domain
MGNTFSEWLVKQIEIRGWSQSELARRANTTSTTVSRIIHHERLPGIEFCRGVARAFGMVEIEVLRAAGLANALPAVDEQGENLLAEFYQLPDADRKFIFDQVRGLRHIREEQIQYNAHSRKGGETAELTEPRPEAAPGAVGDEIKKRKKIRPVK